ncbi:polysaccharide deacetylase family protein [Alistipes sp.]|uniref:polysaccharide deacetylase family protein n=1 Tax=Alistipes sp. TaxID=1872444 RepID=UPI0023EFC73E|nr:polysaccharide deacetylase family protein [Alistipes sp.]
MSAACAATGRRARRGADVRRRARPEQTPRVLDTLRTHGVRATFFLIGSKAELHRRSYAVWPPRACNRHSHVEPHARLPDAAKRAMAADILRCRSRFAR